MPSITAARRAEERFLCFSFFAVLHSGVTKTPIWSAERLTSENIDAAENLPGKRPNNFHAEKRLPVGERSELADYHSASSTSDRGHMSPNGDMPTKPAQSETFTLANMIPQDACNNEVLWEGIESAVRDLTTMMRSGCRPRIQAIYVPSLGQAAAYVVDNADFACRADPRCAASRRARLSTS